MCESSWISMTDSGINNTPEYRKCNGYTLYKLVMENENFVNFNYLIVDDATHEAVLIDPAWHFDSIKRIIEITNARLTKVLLTHSHFDHVDLAADVAKEYQCDIAAHMNEIAYYRLDLPRLHGLGNLDSIQIGSTWITCIHTPGHTKGSMCYLLKESLITGDTLFNEGCGVCHLDGGSAEEMFYSLDMLSRSVRKNVRIYPGHSFGSRVGLTFGEVQDMNIYFHITNKDDFVAFRMKPEQRSIFEFS